MKVIISFILLTTAFSQSIEITYADTQQNIFLKKITDISNDVGEFYKRTSTTILNNNKVAVLDVGNSIVQIYDLSGKLIKKFGRSGQGPGEFSQPDKIYSTSSSIIVRCNYKLVFFNYEGKLIADLSLLHNGQVGNPLIVNNSVFVYFDGNSKLSHIEYDSKANKINEFVNKLYKSDGANEDDTILLSNSIRILADEKFIYRIPRGIFKIDLYSHSFDKVKSYQMDIKAIKRDPKHLLENMIFDKSLKGDDLKRAKQYELQLLLKRVSEYENGIRTLIGFYNDLLVIQLRTNDEDEIKILFIRKNKIVATKQFYNSKTTEIRLFKNKLILNKKSDDLGPHIEIYELL